MKEKSCLAEFIRYSSLNVMGMLGLSCYILADTYFVANALGSSGLAALNLAIPVYSFIHGSGLMLGIGGANRYSIFKSRGGEKSDNTTFLHTMLIAVCFTVVFLIAGLYFSDTITSLLGADKATFDMCRVYLRTLLLFSPVFLLNDIIICFVRNDGAPQLAMIAMLIGSFSNIVLDYIFIFLFNMEIFGAVLATCLAPVISLCVLSVFFWSKKNGFSLVKCRISGIVCRNILIDGMPSLVAEMSSGIVMIVFNTIILRLNGNSGVAAYGVISNISLVVIAVYTGIAQGIQPIISKYYGKNNSENIGKVLKYSIFTVALLSVIIYSGIFLGADYITDVFNRENDPVLNEIAIRGMKIYFTACVCAGLNIVFPAYFISINCARPANIISFLRGFIIIIPLAFLLSNVLEVAGLWSAFPLTELAVTCVVYILYRTNKIQTF